MYSYVGPLPCEPGSCLCTDAQLETMRGYKTFLELAKDLTECVTIVFYLRMLTHDLAALEDVGRGDSTQIKGYLCRQCPFCLSMCG